MPSGARKHGSRQRPQSTLGRQDQRPSRERPRRSAWKDLKSEAMPPGRVLNDQRRIQDEEAKLSHYTTYIPPDSAGHIQAHIILAGDEHVPRRLEKKGAFDDIARRHQVYIDQPKTTLVRVRGEYIQRIREATKDINRSIYAMRLSNNPLDGIYIVQPPSRAPEKCLVKVTINDRPRVVENDENIPDPSAVAPGLYQEILKQFISSVDHLKSLGEQIKLRVKFGQIIVGTKKKAVAEPVGYSEFSRFMEQLSKREAPILRNRLNASRQAEEMIAKLEDPRLNPGCDLETHNSRCEVIMTLEKAELVHAVLDDQSVRPQLQTPDYIVTDDSERMNLVVSAPDMKTDWSFRADAFEPKNIPDEVKQLSGTISLHPVENPLPKVLSRFRLPTVRPGRVLSPNQQVRETRIQKSIEIPYKETPFVVKVTVFREWEGVKVHSKPREGWTVDFYATQWDGSLNCIDQDTNARDWGEGMVNVWPGSEPLEERLEDFVRYILEVQCLMEQIT